MFAAALDGLAFSKWKGGDLRGAEALLDQALALCVPGLLFFFITLCKKHMSPGIRCLYGRGGSGAWALIQGYLAHKKTSIPRTLQ